MTIVEALNRDPFSSHILIAALKEIPILANEYNKRVRHYILEKHTLLVMSEHEKHFGAKNLPLNINKDLFRLTLALHDIGKAKAVEAGNINLQHNYTKTIVANIKNHLPLNNDEITLMLNIISIDPIGLFLQNKISIQKAKSIIGESAKKSNLSISNFFRILVRYYQSDIASYTNDAGGLRFLEKLFHYYQGEKYFDDEKKRLIFSKEIEKKFTELKFALKDE